jgi:Bacterial Ig-like domain (group 3)
MNPSLNFRLRGTAPRVLVGALAIGCLTLTPLLSSSNAATTNYVTASLFAPTSVWNAAVPANAAIDPGSSAIVAAVTATTSSANGGYPNSVFYSSPLYVVGPAQPLVPVILNSTSCLAGSPPCSNNNPFGQLIAAGVPIPANAKEAVGTDGHMTIYQPSTNSLWEFWQATSPAQNAPGLPAWSSYGDSQWHASWGGAMNNVSHSPGYYDDYSWPGKSTTSWGSTATSLPVIGGIPLISELESGHIDHALGIALPSSLICAPTRNVWPAQRDDGSNTTSGCVPEGTHLRINPSLNLSTLHLSPFALMMATAAQKYGMIVRDQSCSCSPRFYVEDPTQYGTNPYTGSTGLFDGLSASAVMQNFPWAQTQVLPMSWHRSMTAATTTTTMSAPPASLNAGQQVTVNATVSASTGSTVPGAVYLQDGGKTVDTTLLSRGTAKLSMTLSSVGQHTLAVVYGGDENAKPSTSASVTVTVLAASTPSPTPSSTPTPSPTPTPAPTATATPTPTPTATPTPQSTTLSLTYANHGHSYVVQVGTTITVHLAPTASLHNWTLPVAKIETLLNPSQLTRISAKSNADGSVDATFVAKSAYSKKIILASWANGHSTSGTVDFGVAITITG